MVVFGLQKGGSVALTFVVLSFLGRGHFAIPFRGH